MLVLLLLLSRGLCTIEFRPQDTLLQYAFNNEATIKVILGMSTLRERQAVVISSEKLVGADGTVHLVDLQAELRPISDISVFLDRLDPFAPSNVLQIDDLLCGSTTLNSPCINRKSMCCVDLCRGTNYYKCRVPTGTEYNRFGIKEVDVRLGLKIRIGGSSESQELVLLSSDNKTRISIGPLTVQLSLEANDSISEILSDFSEDTIIQLPGLTSLDDLRILLDNEQLTMDEDTWINRTSCDVVDDDEFRLERDTIQLVDLLDGTYSGSLTGDVLRLTRNMDMILYITIAATK